VEEDGVLQGGAVLPEEERAGRETVHDDQACAGAAGAVAPLRLILELTWANAVRFQRLPIFWR